MEKTNALCCENPSVRPSFDDVLEQVKEQIAIDCVPFEQILQAEELAAIIAEVLRLRPEDKLRVDGVLHTAADVQAVYAKLENEHIMHVIETYKHGRMLVASYEALRFQRLDLFTVTLRQIGAYIARTQLKDAVSVLEKGDGNSNEAPVVDMAGETLTYNDLVDFWNTFDPYQLNTIVASPDMAAAILKLSEMRDGTAGLSFHGTGKIVTPLGANLLKSSAVPAGKLIGLDKTCALEMVQAGGIMTEYDKLIDRQLERAAITQISGFAKIYTDAAKVLA